MPITTPNPKNSPIIQQQNTQTLKMLLLQNLIIREGVNKI